MQNSIALPVATELDRRPTIVRMFCLVDGRWREIQAKPFMTALVERMNEARKVSHFEFQPEPQWCAALFFPEEWPPQLIEDFLRSSTWQDKLPLS